MADTLAQRILALLQAKDGQQATELYAGLNPNLPNDLSVRYTEMHDVLTRLIATGHIEARNPDKGLKYTYYLTELGHSTQALRTLDISPDYEGLTRIVRVLQTQVMESGRLIERAEELLEAMNENGFSALKNQHYTLVLKALEALVEREHQRIAAINADLPVQKPQREDPNAPGT